MDPTTEPLSDPAPNATASSADVAADQTRAVIWVGEVGPDSRRASGRRRGRHNRARTALTTEQIVTASLSAVGVLVAMVFVWLQLQPSELLRDTLTAGGDMGAHVWGPDYLRREILPHLSLSGWTKDWYAGFPAYKFYMVAPALLVVLLDLLPFVSYAVAFKLVTVLGLVALPGAAYFMGRMFRLPFPGPVLMAFGTLPFIFDFDERFRIIGGNAASTLAGEFSFSIALAVCLVYLGVVARGLETGRFRAWAAVLFALVMLNHLIPAMFAVVATVLLGLWRLAMDTRKPLSGLCIAAFVGSVVAAAWGGFGGGLPVAVALLLPVLAVLLIAVMAWKVEPAWRATMFWIAPVGITGALITGFWAFPFVRNHVYFNDMGWERLQNYRDNLAPAHSLTMVWYVVFMLCVLAVVLSIIDRQLIGGFLASSALTMGVMFVSWPNSQMWNARFLPFYYLSLYLLAAVGLALFINVVPGVALRSLGAVFGALGMLFVAALPLGIVPGSQLKDGQWNFFGLFDAPPSFVDDWARWNYSGYQGKPKWPEYEALIAAMSEIGGERGCGRAMWEYQTETLNSYGTPMALMLLPYWTRSCIGSMEGLYFESSATTPYHFMNQSELSAAPSRAQRALPYSPLNVDLGVQHLQLLGVKYYMALSQSAKDQADSNNDLSYIRDSGPWSIYEVTGSALVAPLPNEPAVLTDVGPGQKSWLDPSTRYYNDPDRWDVTLAGDGPAVWQRIKQGAEPEVRPVPTFAVTNIDEGSDTISFDVDEIGRPVLVKTSYFPNWQVKGAKGPYRVMPNLMVVVPTSYHVELSYRRTMTDWLGILMTLAGLAGVVVLAKASPLELRRPQRRRAAVLTAADLDVSRYVLVFPDEAGLSALDGFTFAEPDVGEAGADPTISAWADPDGIVWGDAAPALDQPVDGPHAAADLEALAAPLVSATSLTGQPPGPDGTGHEPDGTPRPAPAPGPADPGATP